MSDLVFFYPEGHAAHAEFGHSERPERVEAIVESLAAAGWWGVYPNLETVEVPQTILEAIHSPSYLSELQAASRAGRRFDSDTYLTSASWELALQSAGGALAVARAVWAREAQYGFALTRPPGHHATPYRAMGFCLLNNIALAAEDLLQTSGAERLAIIDIDLHHGNGTQDIFWERGDVLYISTHQSPLYPGTGHLKETGAGRGAGCTLNLPLPPHSGDEAMQAALRRLILPALDRYSPQMVLLSVGFDAHWLDPLGHLIWTAAGYGRVVGQLRAYAQKACQGRIALILEGGYDLDAGRACAQASVSALLDLPWKDPLGGPPYPENDRWELVIEEALEVWGLEESTNH